MNLIGISDLHEFEKILRGEVLTSKLQDASIYYLNENNSSLFLLDEKKLKLYRKAPILTTSLMLNNMKLLEAMNNKYIPIIEKNSHKTLFTLEEFNEIRKKMSGIKEYNAGDFLFSENLYFDGLDYYLERIDKNIENVKRYRQPIYNEIKRAINKVGLSLTIGCNSGGDVELVETGSTSRYTNIPNEIEKKWDFDFTIRFNPENTWKVKEILETDLSAGGHITRTSKFKVRLTDVKIPGLEDVVDIDFSLTPQKDNYLSTEDAISERLGNIKTQDEYKYKLVVANIMYAKDLLKTNGAYKPSRGIIDGDRQNGGLGGVGIENMILQNGGSFIDAAIDFVVKAENKEFLEFEQNYFLMDPGCNHVAKSKGIWPFDNFVVNNMRYLGFEKTRETLKKFLLSIHKGVVKR